MKTFSGKKKKSRRGEKKEERRRKGNRVRDWRGTGV